LRDFAAVPGSSKPPVILQFRPPSFRQLSISSAGFVNVGHPSIKISGGQKFIYSVFVAECLIVFFHFLFNCKNMFLMLNYPFTLLDPCFKDISVNFSWDFNENLADWRSLALPVQDVVFREFLPSQAKDKEICWHKSGWSVV
jgi:hypothetical protein